MEGKTVEEVEREAKDKKALEVRRQKASEKAKNANLSDDGRFIQVPNTSEDMIRQAARAIERAFKDGIIRQTVRLALVQEGQPFTELEEWPGGAKQMYREAGKPLTIALLREARAPTEDPENNDTSLPPRIKDQDIWDFDGSGLITAEAVRPSGDIQALVFANTDTKYIEDISVIDETMGKRLILLVNPFWRNVDSWGFNILAPNAKKKAQAVIFDKGYDETYSFQRFSVRGEKCVALKVYPYDWQLFAYREDESAVLGGQPFETAIRLGSSKDEPTSSLFTELLNARPEFKTTRNMRQMKNLF